MFKKCARIKTGCLALLVVQLMFIYGIGNLSAKAPPEKEYPELEYPRGILEIIDSTATDKLLRILKSKSGWDGSLLRQYFHKGGYDPELADFVIYIDSTGEVRGYDLFRKGKKTEHLFGAKHFFVLIFSEIDLNTEVTTEKGEKKVAAFGVKLTPLNYPRDPVELGLLGSIEQVLPFHAPESKEEVLKSEDKEISLERISSEDSPSLYAGMGSFTLENKTKNRITIWPLKKEASLQISVNDVDFDKLVPWLKDHLKPQPPEITLLINLMKKQIKDFKDNLEEYNKPNTLEKDKEQMKEDIVKALNEFERSYKGHLKDIIPHGSLKENSDIKIRSLFFTFGNYSNSRLGGSIGLVNTGRAYLLGHIYLNRPLIPPPSGGKFLNKFSISLFAGTKIYKTDEFLKDNIVGLSIRYTVVGYWGGDSRVPCRRNKVEIFKL